MWTSETVGYIFADFSQTANTAHALAAMVERVEIEYEIVLCSSFLNNCCRTSLLVLGTDPTVQRS